MKPDARLLQAFLDARYVVQLDEDTAVQVLIGHPTPALDPLAQASGSCWALFNPGNARSAPWPDAFNARRMQVLLRLLKQHGLAASPAESYAEDGSWNERGVLVHAIALRQLDALALRFGQHAAIIGAPGRPAQLRLYGRQWRSLHA